MAGWELDRIDYEYSGGINVSVEGATTTIECLDSDGEVSCVYNNVTGTRHIPTLSEWGLMTLAGLIGIIGLYAVRRRKTHA